MDPLAEDKFFADNGGSSGVPQQPPAIKKFLRKLPKTPVIFLAGVLLFTFANLAFKTARLSIEPISYWDEKTVMVLRKTSSKDFWDGVEEILVSLNPEFRSLLADTVSKTGNSPLIMAKNLLPEPFELIITEKNSNEESGSPLKYDFILVTKSLGPGIENIQSADSAARDFASWYLPQSRYIKLNDGTRVPSQIADPAHITFKKEIFQGQEIKYLREAGLPFEYAYVQNNGWLYFGTSLRAIERSLSRDGHTLPFEYLARNCAAPNTSAQIFFNPRLFEVSNTPSPLMLGSPFRGILRIFTPDKTLIKANNVSFYWERCAF